ncbi:MAG TPA: tetratricopeptide repeat protein [Syntrophales bacterium]|nr:tetratricopeptide repeat protein [Syntrophales bacterium]
MNRSTEIGFAAILICILAVAACAMSPWDQERADAHVNIGAAYLGSARYNDALKELLEAEKLSPRDPSVHYYLGITYYRKGLSDNAVDEFKKALALKPGYSEVQNYLGVIYLEKGQWDGAIQYFKDALSNPLYETPDKALFNIGMAYQGKKDFDKALKYLEEAKNKRPNTVPIALIDLHMGLICYDQGDFKKATTYFKSSIKTDPNLLQSRYGLGLSYLKLNDPEKAKTEFKAIVEAAPDTELGKEAKKSLDSLVSGRR